MNFGGTLFAKFFHFAGDAVRDFVAQLLEYSLPHQLGSEEPDGESADLVGRIVERTLRKQRFDLRDQLGHTVAAERGDEHCGVRCADSRALTIALSPPCHSC